VIGPKRHSAPETAIQIDAGRIVTIDRRCEVLIDAVQLRVWSQRTRRKIFRAIHQAGGTVRSRSRANGWNRRVGIRTQDVVVAVRSIVGETERCRGAETLFDFESIVDGGCRLCIRLDPTALGAPLGHLESSRKWRPGILLVW